MRRESGNFPSGKILVTGARGQVGRALCALLGDRAIAAGRDLLDLSRPDSLESELDAFGDLSAIFNAGAYTQVDLAEAETEAALRINGVAPGVLARWCARRATPFVHFSTDYVFSGEGNLPWIEDSSVAPINAYGRSKLAGELAVTEAGGKYLIFRTSWVYDSTGKNFLNTMLRLRAERDHLRIVSDQIGAPTYAPHLARATLGALERASRASPFPSGIYHLSGGGETSWHGFASAIFDGMAALGTSWKPCRVEAVSSAAFAAPARRPSNSRMNCSLAEAKLGARLPDWRSSLAECLQELHAGGLSSAPRLSETPSPIGVNANR